jgi:putative membrane protein
MKTSKKEKILILLLCVYIILTIWSIIQPYHLELWFYEAGPALIGVGFLLFTYRHFKFTKTTYVWCFIAACLMTIGAHYSYSLVPLFEWLKEPMGWDRNNYDKLGHVVQGVVPVFIVRELLVKKLQLTHKGWLNLLSLSFSLSISAGYEIIEWFSLYINTINSNDFLGSQGFMWAAQTDMFMALLGGVLVILLGKRNLQQVINSSNDLVETE